MPHLSRVQQSHWGLTETEAGVATALSPPRGVGSAVEGMGLVFWILEVRDGRATPFRNLHAGTLARPQEETPESLSYPLPQFLSYIYLLSWIRGWSFSVLHSPHNWASPQAPPLQERWVKLPSPSGACEDEWGWGPLLGSLGRHMWGSEQVKGTRADLHHIHSPPVGSFILMGTRSDLLVPLFQKAPDCKFSITWSKSLTLSEP